MRHRILALSALVLVAAGAVHAAVFTVKPGPDTKVVFVSKAPTETFEGKTNRMQGTLTLDPSAVGDTITVHLEVDMASLDTGKKMRNQHMRDEHLETDKYPKAVFDGAAVLSPSAAKLEPGKTAAFEIEGTFLLHGVSRRLRCPAEATFTPAGKGGTLAFKADFPVSLPDYNIKRPEFLFLKLAEVQQVTVSGVASSAP
jgi:polyisoprenoid-binding protein YceI